MSLQAQMDRFYSTMTLEQIPWNMTEPPPQLVELVESRWLVPCDAVDVGCGAGNYAAWLAQHGFRMTGLDLSASALVLAKRLADEKGLTCRWLQANLWEPMVEPSLLSAFDFAYDWEVLHHVVPEQRPTFVSNVSQMLRPGGRYFSVCFSEADTSFEGTGHYRRSRIGTDLYFSSEAEMRALFDPLFAIERLDTIPVVSKSGTEHQVIRALMQRREP